MVPGMAAGAGVARASCARHLSQMLAVPVGDYRTEIARIAAQVWSDGSKSQGKKRCSDS